jgi:Flp pilus assembly protein TadG
MMARLRDDAGTSTIEFLFIVPILLALVLFGMAVQSLFSVKSDLEEIAGDSARWAIEESSAENAIKRANTRAEELAAENGLDVHGLDIEVQTGSFERGTPLRVRATYQTSLISVPAWGLRLPNSITVSAEHIEMLDRYRSR